MRYRARMVRDRLSFGTLNGRWLGSVALYLERTIVDLGTEELEAKLQDARGIVWEMLAK